MTKVPKPLTRIFQQEWTPIFKEWYNELSLHDRLIIGLRALGHTNAYVALKIGIKEQTVKNRIVAIRKAFHATFYN